MELKLEVKFAQVHPEVLLTPLYSQGACGDEYKAFQFSLHSFIE